MSPAAAAIPIPPPRRALVIKLGHIGDVLVTTPVLSALKEAWPQVEITMLVNQGTEAMVAHHPLVSRVEVLRRDHAGAWAGLGYQLGLLRRLRAARFDLCLELSGGDRGAFLAWASRAKTRVGFAPKEPHFRARAFHRLADYSGTQRHMVEAFLRQPSLLGIEAKDDRLSLEPGPEARDKAAALLAGHGLEPGGFALVHPTSRWMFKCWTPEGNAAVIARLNERGLPVVLTAAPDKKELAMVGRIKELLPPEAKVIDLSGQVDLTTLAALIAQAKIFCGVDSAPMHMAAALGTPVLTIFGPSGEAMWGPWRVKAEVLVGDCPDHPCGRAGCDNSKQSRCLDQMPVERVLGALDRLLAEA